MECKRASPLLTLAADGELGFWHRWHLSAHVASCEHCSAKLEDLGAMRSALREGLAYHRAPPALAARIGASLGREEPPSPARARPAVTRRPPLAIGAGGLAGALAGVALTLLFARPGGPSRPSTLDAVIDSHVRSMMADHLTDVPSSDRHTVKPWLSTHLDLSPPTPDLAAEGFQLVGGRMDYIDSHPAAAVVYRRARHVINLFAWASQDRPNAPFRSEARQGFNVVTWRAEGLTYFAISDLEAAQLLSFARLVAGPTPPG